MFIDLFNRIIDSQSSKKTKKNVRKAKSGNKMSDFHIFFNKSKIRLIFIMKFVSKLLFIQLLSNCVSFLIEMSTNGSGFWSQPTMFGFIQNNVRNPISQDPAFRLGLRQRKGFGCRRGYWKGLRNCLHVPHRTEKSGLGFRK